MSKSRLSFRPVVHKSTGGILPKIPEPVDPVGNAPRHLTPNTVALPDQGEVGACEHQLATRRVRVIPLHKGIPAATPNDVYATTQYSHLIATTVRLWLDHPCSA